MQTSGAAASQLFTDGGSLPSAAPASAQPPSSPKSTSWLFTSLRLAVLTPTGCGLTRCPLGTFDHGFVRNRIDSDSLLRQTVEKLPTVSRPAAIEPKRELVKVVFEVLMRHRSLVRTHQPALEQRRHSMHPRHEG